MDGLSDSDSSQRWWEQHSELDQLVQSLDATLASASRGKTLQALEDLESVLDAHFAVEEGVYFPLVEKLSPQHGSTIREARDGHVKIGRLLHDLRQLVEGGQLAAARPVLNQFLDCFRLHETHEVRLLADLEALQRGSGF